MRGIRKLREGLEEFKEGDVFINRGYFRNI
jgi:hypothetical protein